MDNTTTNLSDDGNHYTIQNRLPELLDDTEFCQQLIDFIPDPCFILFKVTGERFLINKSLARLLKYSSLLDFYNQNHNLFQIFESNDIPKLNNNLQRVYTKNSFVSCCYNFITRNNIQLNCTIRLYHSILSTPDAIPVWFGLVVMGSRRKAYQIDRNMLNWFNNDKFLDETILILDFKGNVISSNKKSHIINFFVELSDSGFNLFNIIDKSYQEILTKRIAELQKGNITPPQEYKLVEKDNKTAYIEVYSRPIIYKKKRAIVSLIRDITLRKETEKKLLYTVVQTEEKERQRFARDLHDELGPFLSGLKLYLHEIQTHNTNAEKREALISYVAQMIDEAVEKVRMISSNLTPQNMIDIGLTGSVNKMIERLNRTGRIQISLKTDGQELGIEPSFIITLYRIILELINNGIKHAETSKMVIQLLYGEKTIRLIYSDDGKGFNLDKELLLNKGIGLKSILNRIELYQGTYKFRRTQPAGIEFDMSFPSK